MIFTVLLVFFRSSVVKSTFSLSVGASQSQTEELDGHKPINESESSCLFLEMPASDSSIAPYQISNYESKDCLHGSLKCPPPGPVF